MILYTLFLFMSPSDRLVKEIKSSGTSAWPIGIAKDSDGKCKTLFWIIQIF